MKRLSPRCLAHPFREGRQAAARRAHVRQRLDPVFGQLRLRRLDQIVDHCADLRASQLADQPLGGNAGILGLDAAPALGDHRYLHQLIEAQQAGA